jgi:hypothetical protein
MAPGSGASEVTESLLVVVSATNAPKLGGTELYCGRPGVRWLSEAITARFDHEFPDSMRFSFSAVAA